ncbi:MAG TPA: hypothetical protein VHW23_39885 [Kofleriaceae bacterium]|nr:hypothetical protein [Kofleriaceae bacterium]
MPVAFCAACKTQDVVVGGFDEIAQLRAIPNRDLDLLFVIDDSPSMGDNQAALAVSFPRMVDKLAQLDGGLPNLHIGVITSDMGTQSSAVATPGPSLTIGLPGECAGVGDDGALQHAGDPALADAFLSDVADATAPDGRARNYAGDLRDAVSGLVQVGASGCGFEQHLAAVRRSFVNPANAGFLRPGANLAIVILADEDDCSVLDPALLDPTMTALGPLDSFRCFAQGTVCDGDDPRALGDKHGCRPRTGPALVEPIDRFIASVLAVKPDPREVMVAAIVGDPTPVRVEFANPSPVLPPPAALAPSCVFDGPAGRETAYPGVRFAAFLDGFPGRSQLASICGNDLSGPLDAIGATAKQMMGDPCLDTTVLADTSPESGVQPACQVVDVRDSDTDHPAALPPCAGDAATDCYALEPDTAACPATGDHLRVRVRRSAAVPADTWTHVLCQRAG